MFIQCHFNNRSVIKEFTSATRIGELKKAFNLETVSDSFYVIHNGRNAADTNYLEDGCIYHLVPRILGGKGGFGSMLRAIGAQIEKTTSREACRDLSGRRMRDVNNEKKLKEWAAKESDREREKEERRREKLAAQMAGPKHKFNDPEYHKQKSKVQEDLDDALERGLKRAGEKSSSDTSACSKQKKSKKSNTEWLGMDLDSDDLESDSDNEPNPGSPTLKVEEHITLAETEKSKLETNASDKNSNMTQDSDKDINKANTLISTNESSGAAVVLADKVKEEKTKADEPIDLDAVERVDDLLEMGLDRLKNALIARGLKCGGNLEERAVRLFSVKGLKPEQYSPAIVAKLKGVGKKSK